MKKKYVIPEIEVVKMETEGVMMAGSTPIDNSQKEEDVFVPGKDEGAFLSKEHNFNLWED